MTETPKSAPPMGPASFSWMKWTNLPDTQVSGAEFVPVARDGAVMFLIADAPEAFDIRRCTPARDHGERITPSHPTA